MKQRRKKCRMGISIRAQLILGFMVPVIFLIAIGWISYTKASDGLITNYESSACTALEMTMNSFDSSMQTVASIAMELSQDATVNAYALGGYNADTAKMEQAKTTIRNNMNVKHTSSKMMEAIHIIPVQNNDVLTTEKQKAGNVASFLEELKNSEDGELLADGYLNWGSNHTFLDKNMVTGNYQLYCSQSFHSGSVQGLVVIDISQDAIKELLSQLDFGTGSYVSFMNKDGKEISTDAQFSASQLEIAEVEGQESYLEYNGQTYFYMTAQSTVTGGKIVALVPKAYITQSSDDIRKITFGMVLAACVLAILISCVIITGISRNISKSVKWLDAVSQGNLTEQNMKTKAAHNEFGKLHAALRNTVKRMRELIGTVSNMKDEVQSAGAQVMTSSSQLSETVENVSIQMEEINEIVTRQNNKIAECNQKMEELSVQIKNVSGNILAAMEEAANSHEMIDSGMQTVEGMVKKSSLTSAATTEVQQQVSLLAKKLESITDFVSNIQDIASQTNLLSLNASIEAARAGEHGRGFSVVAEEIRKLADNSDETAVEIQKIITEIGAYSEKAIEKVTEAGEISSGQMESAKRTITAFEQMNQLMENLINGMENISVNVEHMNEGRKDALNSIRDIGTSSEHTVDATTEINGLLEKQLEAAESLQAETVKMEESMKQLELAIETFQL